MSVTLLKSTTTTTTQLRNDSFHYPFSDHNGSTTLSLRIALWDKSWVTDLGNISSPEFAKLKNKVINEVM